MPEIPPESACDELRIREHLVKAVDRTARDRKRRKLRKPLGLRPGAHDGVDQRDEHAPVAHTLGVGRKARITRPLRLSGGLAEFRELQIVAHRDDHMPVRARKHLVRHDVLVRVPGASRRASRYQVVHVHDRHHGNGRIEKRCVDPLSFACALAVRERGEDRDSRVHAGHEIRDGDASLLRPAAGEVVALAGDAHEPAHALDDEVVAGLIGVRPVLPESGDRRVDDARVDRAHAPVIEAVFRKPVDLEVLDDDVGAASEIENELPPLGFREVDRHRQLAAIAGEKVRRFGSVVALLVPEIRRTPCTGVVATVGALDLDDRRAEVGKELRAPWTRENAREVEDGEVTERA